MTSRASDRIRLGRLAARLAMGIILLALAACTMPGSKAGPHRPVTSLHLATVEARGAPYTKDVDFFAARVAALTGDSVRIITDFEVIPWTPTSEQEVTTRVQAGHLDLAFIPPRAFDLVDISEFKPLQTPLLIDSPELAGAIATSPIATGMLDGLAAHQMIGLGLVYEGLRRPVAINGALTHAHEFQGLTVRVPPSRLSDRVFTALGATPDHGADHVMATTGRPYPLVETEFLLAGKDFPLPNTTTVNVVLYPKYDAIVASTQAFAKLDPAEQQAVRQAAADTAAASRQTTGDEESLARSYCESGGIVITAAQTELAAMGATLQPVIESVRANPDNASAITRIESLKRSTDAPRFTAPQACRPRSGDGARLPSPTVAPTP